MGIIILSYSLVKRQKLKLSNLCPVAQLLGGSLSWSPYADLAVSVVLLCLLCLSTGLLDGCQSERRRKDTPSRFRQMDPQRWHCRVLWGPGDQAEKLPSEVRCQPKAERTKECRWLGSGVRNVHTRQGWRACRGGQQYSGNSKPGSWPSRLLCGQGRCQGNTWPPEIWRSERSAFEVDLKGSRDTGKVLEERR